jgi:muconate cycloisomerase
MCQLAACTSNIRVETYPVDILGPLYYFTGVARNPIRLEAGYAVVPEGPGLGLDIDEQHIQMLSSGRS